MFLYICLRNAHGRDRQPPPEVGIQVEGELRLHAVPLEHLRQRLDPGERALENLGTDAARRGFRAQFSEPDVERRKRKRQRRHRGNRLRLLGGGGGV